jgi:sigma-E factor negative regulatory protein RseC
MSTEETTVRATVRKLDGDEALVEVEQGGCGRCHEEGGCGGQQLTQMFCSGPKHYRVANPHGAQIGDQVTVAIASGTVRKTANLAYGLPLTVTIAGAAIGTQISGDVGAMIGALVGVVGAVFYIRHRAQAAGGNLATRPYIISRS